MENSLPKNWVDTDLDTVILRMTNGSSLKQVEEPFEGSLPISRIETIWNETIDLDRVKYVDASEEDIEKYGLEKGDVLFSHINSDKHLGKTAIFNLDETLIHGINLLLLRAMPQFNGGFLNYLLRHYRFSGKFIEVAQRSVNQSSINQKKLKSFRVPLPPLPEQQRIVAKLDELFGHLDTLKTRLENIPQILKNFRQAVLTQAVTGKLTEEWRVGRELEETLMNVDLGDYLNDIKYGTSKKSDYEIDGMPILRIPNIKDGEIDTSDLKFSILDQKEYQKVLLKKGDVLIIRSNGSISIVGKTAIIRDQKEMGYAGYLVRLRAKKELNPEYLNYSLSSPNLRRQIEEKARSTSGVNNINTTEIKELKINVFDIKEQAEIVKRVEHLFAKADAIEAQYQSLKTKIDSLPQAILAKAFKGELVEQLPTDGDAKDLLEEIKRLKAEVVGQVGAKRIKKVN